MKELRLNCPSGGFDSNGREPMSSLSLAKNVDDDVSFSRSLSLKSDEEDPRRGSFFDDEEKLEDDDEVDDLDDRSLLLSLLLEPEMVELFLTPFREEWSFSLSRW